MLRAKELLDEDEVNDEEGLTAMLSLPLDEQLSRIRHALHSIELQLEHQGDKQHVCLYVNLIFYY